MTWSPRAKAAQLKAVAALLNGGALALYGEDAEPLARLTFADPAFHAPADGTCEAYPLVPDVSAARAGDATVFQCLTARGDLVCAGSVGHADADLILTDTTIYPGTRVEIDSFHLEG